MFNTPFYNRFKLPLSGDVTQAINPWSWWSQNGLINVNVMASSDRMLEKRIVEDVAGYGKQLGRIVDMLAVFRRYLPEKSWDVSVEENKAIEDFDDLVRGIAAVKAGYAAPTRESIDDFIAGLKYLKKQDGKAYEDVINRLESELMGKLE
jgi:hypothetical protein